MREIVVVRTHVASPAALAAYDRYAALSGRPTVFCCDETAGPVDTGGRPKLSFTAGGLAAHGLRAEPGPRGTGWSCGDYCHYVLRRDLPDFDRCWLLEPDVLLNLDRPAEFFDSLAVREDAFLAAWFGPADPSWRWAAAAGRHYATVHRCLFPVTRLSAPAADHLLRARRALATSAARTWLNDEAFVASELMAAGFACADLNATGRVFWTERSFRWRPAHDAARLAAAPRDGLLWHPVREAAAA